MTSHREDFKVVEDVLLLCKCIQDPIPGKTKAKGK